MENSESTWEQVSQKGIALIPVKDPHGTDINDAYILSLSETNWDVYGPEQQIAGRKWEAYLKGSNRLERYEAATWPELRGILLSFDKGRRTSKEITNGTYVRPLEFYELEFYEL